MSCPNSIRQGVLRNEPPEAMLYELGFCLAKHQKFDDGPSIYSLLKLSFAGVTVVSRAQ